MSDEPKPPVAQPCPFHLGAANEACWRCGLGLAEHYGLHSPPAEPESPTW
jgi:hypothetical protein